MVAPEDRLKTAFVVPWGQYEYTRIPFGIKTAPRFFQYAMVKILKPLKFVRVFLDDILIFSSTQKEHENHVVEVLDLLRKSNISINFEKSAFVKTSVNYLGKIISDKGIRPDISRVDAFALKIPEAGKITRKQLKSIMSFLEWFRPYVKDLSKKLYHLTNKTKKCKVNLGK